MSVLVTAATTAAAATSTARRAAGWRRGTGGPRRGKDRKLDGGPFAGALGAGDFLLLVDDDFFEVRLAVVANVFVDGHRVTPVDSF